MMTIFFPSSWSFDRCFDYMIERYGFFHPSCFDVSKRGPKLLGFEITLNIVE